ncbi:hypothetical protein [Salisaeta longa]|uniref:hypothetical protein n=1 Tax=Salisaeta longa TaxID=503170 RepID=UPI0003B61C4E|nr:hypothetical protein [Salisaeta longa]
MADDAPTPEFIPEYNKPDAPGIHMNFDNTVSLYHIVAADDDFETAAHDLFALLKEAQERFPEWPRVLYLDIQGHMDDQERFDDEMVELQQEFLIAAMGKFFTALALPIVAVVNPDKQSNEVPDELVLQAPGSDLPEDAWPRPQS